MTDPKRWTDPGDSATPLEKSLLLAGQSMGMPTDQKQTAWLGISTALSNTAPVASPTGSATVARESVRFAVPAAVKALGLAAVVLGTGALGRYGLLRFAEHGSATPNVQTGAVSSVPGADSVSSAAVAPPALASITPAPPSSGVERTRATTSADVNRSSVSSRVSQLREESQAVLAARSALRANDAAGALRLLDQARVRFGGGALGEEREALTIEALARSGSKAQAARRAQGFLKAHPRSPHAADVQRYVAQ